MVSRLDNVKTVQLAVAKICHEIANYLSIIKFLQEDIKEKATPEILELNKNIDLLSYTMDFFRNAYSDSVQSAKTPEIIKAICTLKEIDLKIAPEILENLENNNLINAISLFVYIISKVSKSGERLEISKENDAIVIKTAKTVTLQKSIQGVINGESAEEDIFNILACYARYLLNSAEYNAEIKISDKLQIRIWK